MINQKTFNTASATLKLKIMIQKSEHVDSTITSLPHDHTTSSLEFYIVMINLKTFNTASANSDAEDHDTK